MIRDWFSGPEGGPFHLRWCLYGAVAALIGAAVAWGLLRAAGYPWNMMRRQPSVEPMEKPYRPPSAGVRAFSKSGWPRSGFALPEHPRSLVMNRGRSIYRVNCSHCHGPEGRGNGPVAESLKQPPANLRSRATQLMEGRYLHRLIAHPKAWMPPFADRLSREQRQLVAGYVRTAWRPDTPPRWRKTGEISSVQRGEMIYRGLECARCHGPDRYQKTPGIPPSLAFAGHRYQPDWVRRYLDEPFVRRFRNDGVRSTLRMPAFELTSGEIDDLVAYLMTRRPGEKFEDPDIHWGESIPGDLRKGRELYRQYACGGCHTLDGEGGKVGPDLTHVGRRLKPDYVYQFIRDPKKYIPGTAMVDKDLWPGEAEAITRYLMASPAARDRVKTVESRD